MSDETPRIPTSAELAAIELGAALAGMGPDTDRAAMLTIRMPDGTHVKDIWLSATDVTALTDGAYAMALVADTESQIRAFDDQAAADPLPLAEDDVTEAAVEDLANAFQEYLNSEGDQR